MNLVARSVLFYSIAGTCFVLNPESASAGVDISIDGSASNFDMPLQNSKRSMISGSVDFDIGSHLRLGYTYRVDTMKSSGYKQDSASLQYYYQESQTNVNSNSVNLTLILYYGDLFVPFIQAGAVVKDYYMIEKTGGVTYTIDPAKSPAQPSAGAGLHIVLSRSFNLKLSHTVSPGAKVASPATSDKVTYVLDSTTSMGLVYKL